MALEPPNHLLIGTDNTHLAEYDKVLPSPETQEDPHEKGARSETNISEPRTVPPSDVKLDQNKSKNKSKHIFRIEYTDNTGTVIAVKQGATPPVHSSDQGEDAPIFELIKRVKVFAKTTKDTKKKTQDSSSGEKDKGSAAEKIDGATGAKSNLASRDKSEGSKDKSHDTEDVKLKLKDFDVSPESNATWSLKILSEYLMNALRAVVEYYPGLQLLSHAVEFNEPYKELIHHIDELEHYKDNQPEDHPPEYQKECKEHIEELLGYLRDTFGEKLKEEKVRHQRDPPVCTFPYLWLLFKPGEEVYWKWGASEKQVSSFIVEKLTGGVSADTRATPLNVTNWCINYDCETMGRARYHHALQSFDGEKPIRELKMYPVQFHRDDPKMEATMPRKEHFLQSGKAFFNFCKSGSHYKMLHGRPLIRVGKGGQKSMVHGRVVVDLDEYYLDENEGTEKPMLMANNGGAMFDSDMDDNEDDTTARTGCRCVHCGKKPRQRRGTDWTKFDNIDPDDSPPPDDDRFYRLCDVVVPAWLLADRKWEWVHVSDLHPVQFNENMLDSLVLSPEIKNTVQALAWKSLQRAGNSFSSDFIEGKGNGQIILLHGAPGVGKTATAECVAELMERPLIALTCGDLGTDVIAVESKLKKYMSWGELWNGVVLLDEADVYLESRQRGEVKRNALVSVFLRELEQFQGIMFLTTNRVGTFDDAFLSRIHVGILYRALTDEDREKIWSNHFERLRSEKVEPAVSVHPDAELYISGAWQKNNEVQRDLMDIQWNGREIRNAFQTALALASFDTNGTKKDGAKMKATILRAHHIQSVVAMSKQFKKFVDDTKREGNEENRARSNQLRGSSTGVASKDSSFNLGTPGRK